MSEEEHLSSKIKLSGLNYNFYTHEYNGLIIKLHF